MSHLWDRRPTESAPAFAAFTAYLEMGADRSVVAVGQKLAKSRTLIGRWCERDGWVERAAAYDAMLRTKELAAREKAQATEAATWAARRAEQAAAEWDLSRALIERAKTMLQFPLVEQRVTRTGPDGTPQAVTITPVRWSQRDIPALLETAAKLARLSAGMETSRATVQLEDLNADVLAAARAKALEYEAQLLALLPGAPDA